MIHRVTANGFLIFYVRICGQLTLKYTNLRNESTLSDQQHRVVGVRLISKGKGINLKEVFSFVSVSNTILHFTRKRTERKDACRGRDDVCNSLVSKLE